MKIDINRAIQILDPEHREHYESLDEVNEACRMGIEALKALRWISAKDRLPPTSESVLVIANGQYGNMTLVDAMEFGVYDDIDKAWYLESEPIDGPVNVTWWMYPPEPPRYGG